MTRRERSALLLGSLVVVAALGMRSLAREPAAPSLVERDDPAVLARLQGELMALPALERVGTDVRASLVASAAQLLEGDSEPAAVASLALLMTLTADRFGLQLKRTAEVRDSAAVGRLRRAGTLARFSGDARALTSALAALSTERPLLEVRRIAVKVPEAAAVTSASEILDVEIEVVGWYLVEAE